MDDFKIGDEVLCIDDGPLLADNTIRKKHVVVGEVYIIKKIGPAVFKLENFPEEDDGSFWNRKRFIKYSIPNLILTGRL